jgi:hypothetical protein
MAAGAAKSRVIGAPGRRFAAPRSALSRHRAALEWRRIAARLALAGIFGLREPLTRDIPRVFYPRFDMPDKHNYRTWGTQQQAGEQATSLLYGSGLYP